MHRGYAARLYKHVHVACCLCQAKKKKNLQLAPPITAMPKTDIGFVPFFRNKFSGLFQVSESIFKWPQHILTNL